MNTITETENFYGYIIGLQGERDAQPGSSCRMGDKLYATFEYGRKVAVWEVPDAELFRILADRLSEMAHSRATVGSYGDNKLWIKKENGRWQVTLP